MSRQFDMQRLYILLEAFDRLGAHIYGDQWTGTEPWATSPEASLALRQERQQAIAEVDTVEAEIEKAQRAFNRAIDNDERTQASATLHKLREHEKALSEKLRSIPDISDTYIRDQATFERRRKAEAILRDGLKQGRIRLQFGPNTIIDWRDWCEAPRSRLYIALSMATVAGRLSSLRRAPVFIDRTEFDAWVREIAPLNPDAPQPTPKELCAAFLRAEIRKPKNGKKSDYWDEARKQIPSLSRNAFDQVWAEIVPASWQKAGRRND
ncbi:hypothetical protein [Oceanibaculum indicum]|uniref:Uncharacterized protein n=1 Tax=Oceanibaculum indicum TaxID=526216 RepID=A0A420W9Z1_9PROT|nr:hypothetical protein [Oceanibaculum indicum]RKQ64141.1 hypothetical protein BCL74_3672 [Oceanibaculum indicum]